MRYLLLASYIVFLMGCAQKNVIVPQENNSSLIVLEVNESLPIMDLEYYSQDTSTYASNIHDTKKLLSIQLEYERHYFAPWHYKQAPEKLENVMWPYVSYKPDNAYGENLQPLNQEWFDGMLELSNFNYYDTLKQYAIATQYLSLRNFPTHKPLFKDPREAGEGFPFDYLQNSGVHANEPLYLSHYSKDKAWVYVFSAYATGWVDVKDIAFVSKSVINKYEKAKTLHLTVDNRPIYDIKGRFVFMSRVGMRLPLIKIEKDFYTALAITKGAYFQPTYTVVKIPISQGQDSLLTLSKENLQEMTNIMMHNNYGWGGLYGERDCSSTLRDLFAPFGIWLPRNSAQQARVGKKVDLSLLDNTKKLETIKAQGVPFETLIYRKGHILLYLGTYEDDVIVMHTMWGIKTDDGVSSGRVVIGKTVISTLNLGYKQKDFDVENSLLNKASSMNILTR